MGGKCVNDECKKKVIDVSICRRLLTKSSSSKIYAVKLISTPLLFLRVFVQLSPLAEGYKDGGNHYNVHEWQRHRATVLNVI